MNKTNFIPYTIQKIKDGIYMEKIDKYFDKLQDLIKEANEDGVEIVAYTSHIGGRRKRNFGRQRNYDWH